VITVGARVIACYDSGDLGMRNFTVLTLTGALRFTGLFSGGLPCGGGSFLAFAQLSS
jgi:hypothetical protein